MRRGFIPIPARDQMTQDSRRLSQSCEKARVGVGQDIRNLRPETAGAAIHKHLLGRATTPTVHNPIDLFNQI